MRCLAKVIVKSSMTDITKFIKINAFPSNLKNACCIIRKYSNGHLPLKYIKLFDSIVKG